MNRPGWPCDQRGRRSNRTGSNPAAGRRAPGRKWPTTPGAQPSRPPSGRTGSGRPRLLRWHRCRSHRTRSWCPPSRRPRFVHAVRPRPGRCLRYQLSTCHSFPSLAFAAFRRTALCQNPGPPASPRAPWHHYPRDGRTGCSSRSAQSRRTTLLDDAGSAATSIAGDRVGQVEGVRDDRVEGGRPGRAGRSTRRTRCRTGTPPGSRSPWPPARPVRPGGARAGTSPVGPRPRGGGRRRGSGRSRRMHRTPRSPRRSTDPGALPADTHRAVHAHLGGDLQRMLEQSVAHTSAAPAAFAAPAASTPIGPDPPTRTLAPATPPARLRACRPTASGSGSTARDQRKTLRQHPDLIGRTTMYSETPLRVGVARRRPEIAGVAADVRHPRFAFRALPARRCGVDGHRRSGRNRAGGVLCDPPTTSCPRTSGWRNVKEPTAPWW